MGPTLKVSDLTRELVDWYHCCSKEGNYMKICARRLKYLEICVQFNHTIIQLKMHKRKLIFEIFMLWVRVLPLFWRSLKKNCKNCSNLGNCAGMQSVFGWLHISLSHSSALLVFQNVQNQNRCKFSPKKLLFHIFRCNLSIWILMHIRILPKKVFAKIVDHCRLASFRHFQMVGKYVAKLAKRKVH